MTYHDSYSALRTSVVLVATAIVIKRLWDRVCEPPQLSVLRPRSRGVESLVGNTPLVEIKSLSRLTKCKIYAKLELNNPGGSAKDRVALAIIRENEKSGKLKPNNGDIIFEGTSGSTGISFAVLSNSLGYETHICLSDDTGTDKLNLLRLYGATIEPVRPASIVDQDHYVNTARKRADAINLNPDDPRNAIYADQFENELNWKIHYATTGPELWTQMNHQLDYFVTGSGTGGTICGVGKYLKEKDPSVKVVLSDPQGSSLANRINHGVAYNSVEKEGTRRRHQVDTIVEGIGLNRLTQNFKTAEPYIDRAISVTDSEAVKMAKFLCVNEGVLWGSSAAVNCVAAVKLALRSGPGKTIVTIACDSGTRHLSKFWKEAQDVPDTIQLHDILE